MKNKGGLKSLIFIIVIWLVLFAVLSYLLYDRYLIEEQTFGAFVREDENVSLFDDEVYDEFPDGMMFYGNLRFADKKITYTVDEECSDSRKADMFEAFGILEEKTVLDFTQVSDGGQIQATCSDDFVQPDTKHFIVGEGGPNHIIDNGRYQIISNGTILLYTDDDCKNPLVSLHEILHVLGFQHSSNENSVLYSVSNCKQKFSNDIIDKINSLYEDPSLPDLVFKDVNVSKKGRYLSFGVTVINKGLVKSGNTNLSLFYNDNELDSFELEDFEVGRGKILNVENLKVPRALNEVVFVIDESNRVLEIDESNNRVVLSIKN
ncbi:hypothetical protein CMI46_03100 [Candidatus Pacearchaeota archaeon]|nr:hypothetical protein [Candidatus Pacearchaeota archaeon]|tara:strand:+ start:129 stop:1088 length:960 start_codon:yes stop_codon:yes gene_type:complete